MQWQSSRFGWVIAAVLAGGTAAAQERLKPLDVFQLEFAADPQVAPDGSRVVYVRNSMDIMKDRKRTALWSVSADGSDHRPVTSGTDQASTPRWSPDGKRLVYVSDADGATQLFCRWLDTGQTARLTNLQSGPSSIAWSPDGRWLAFTLHVPDEGGKPFVDLPKKPEGAQWAEPAKVIRSVTYRFDGRGYLREGFSHVFVLPAEGGTPRQLTSGSFHHDGPLAWTPDSQAILFAANRRADWEYTPHGEDLYEVSLDGRLRTLSARPGPENHPVASPDGGRIAFVGHEPVKKGYVVTKLHVMDRDGGNVRIFDFDRSVQSPVWAADGRIYFQFDDQGNTRVARFTLATSQPDAGRLAGQLEVVAKNVGGTTLDRPYASGSFSVSRDGTVAFTESRASYPADVAIARAGESRRATTLNADLLGHRQLGEVEELWCKSSHDQKPIQSWLVKPAGYEAGKKYPLILEIHGGPYANYGDRFGLDNQLYAAAGYAVLYTNPRGSTSYGQAFADEIFHAYPGHDFDDLMSAVDAAVRRGDIDPQRLYVTGGSGGGILTAWIVTQTHRFRAAVAQKPVINWFSFALTSDAYPFFSYFWFPGPPWEHTEQYVKRSPLTYVGQVKTPTMLLTGEQDYRTPMSESEQFYQALKLRKIDAALVRVPNASHSLGDRPSHLVSKAAHVLKWFEMH